ncbi:hypothetical protein MK489_13600 [Myxococcota bacterium]|nr:hypothetical protein [Myxococcota bacterium]
MDETRKAGLREHLAVAFLFLASLGFVVALNLTPVHNGDFWIQLTVGDIVRETGEIPETFEFTYTEAKDERYVEARWLAGLTWSHLYQIQGYAGMIVVKCLFVLCMFGLIALLSHQVGRDPVLAIGLASFTILGINFRSLMRPGLVAFVLALLVLNFLYAFIRTRRPRWLIPLIPLAVVWTNFHPSFVAGFALPACFAAGEVVDGLWRWKASGLKPDWTSIRRSVVWLSVTSFGMLLAALVNPYGVEFFEHMLNVEASDFIRENVWEWQSLFHPRFRGEPFMFLFITTTLFVVVSGIMGRRKLRAAPILLVIAFFPLALSAIRHVPWFEIMASFFLAHTLGHSEFLRRQRVPIALVLAVVLIAGIGYVVENGNTRGRKPGFSNDAPLNPAAIEAIREAEISGNVFHSYSYGDQLAYHFYPDIRIAMDTRIYPEKYYREFRSMTGGNPRLMVEPEKLRDYLARYDVEAIVTEPFNMRVWEAMGHLPILVELGFTGLYQDRDTVIMRRK